jgi:uncharacterized membrane protein
MSSCIVLLCFCSIMFHYITLLHYLLVQFEYLVWTCLVPFTISTSIGYIVGRVKIQEYLLAFSIPAYCHLCLCLLPPLSLLTATSVSAYCHLRCGERCPSAFNSFELPSWMLYQDVQLLWDSGLVRGESGYSL